jgi:uncharacterized protein YggT (Ycf19 family)
MQDDRLAADEARRISQHEAAKAQVERDVTNEIVGRATTQDTPADRARLNHVAGALHERAVDEAVETERELDRARGAARGSQVLDYVFYVIYAFLGMRLLLELMNANEGAGFVQFVHAVTDPLYAPFRGIVPSLSAEGGFTLALPLVVALVAYMLLHAGINGGLRMMAHRKTHI